MTFEILIETLDFRIFPEFPLAFKSFKLEIDAVMEMVPWD